MRSQRAFALAGAALLASASAARADEENPFACKKVRLSWHHNGVLQRGPDPKLREILRGKRVEIVDDDGAEIRIQLDTGLDTRSDPDLPRFLKSATWRADLKLESASGPPAGEGRFTRSLLPHHGATVSELAPIPWEPFFRESLGPALEKWCPEVRTRPTAEERKPIVIASLEPPDAGASSSSSSSSSSGSSGGTGPSSYPGAGAYLAAGAALAALALYARSRRRAAVPLGPAAAPRTLRILVLAANPADTAPIDLEKEVDAIRDRIRQGAEHERVELIPHLSVEFDDVLRTLNQVRPDIVHISGHGTAKGEIHLCDAEGLSNPVSERTLERLFTVLKDDIRVVLLNACYSERQAGAIARVIDCTIGMRRAVRDDVATAFSASFYRAIASGRDLRNAFDQGCLAIAGMPRPLRPAEDRDVAVPSSNDVAGPPPSAPPSSHADEIPVLHERSGVSAADIVLVAARAPR